MAYSNTPVVSTYSTQRIPCVYGLNIPINVSDPSNTSGMKNIVPVTVNNQVVGECRYSLDFDDVGTSGIVRGMYVWEKTIGTIYYFVVVGNESGSSKVYSSTDKITWTAVNTLGTDATTPVRFTEFISSTNTKKLVMVDGLEGYVFTTNAAGTKIVDADFPTPHVPFPIFLDGYLFLAKKGTGDIYNSDLDDPAIWTAGSFISAEQYPDDIQILLKINNYIAAVGTQATEFFYDAANPTASPLARVDGATLAFGTPIPNSVACTKNMAIFLANNNDGSISLQMIQGTKSEELPLGILNSLLISVGNPSQTSSMRGWLYRQNGSLFYGLTVNADFIPAVSPVFVLSLDNKIWTQFTYNYSVNTGGEAFPVVATAPTTSNNMTTYFAGNPSGNNAVFGTISPLATELNVLQEIRTTVEDFGSVNLKTMGKLSVILDNDTSNNTSSSITIYCIDSGDYSTTAAGNIGPITLYSSSSSDYPYTTRLGAFRQRAILLRCLDQPSVRWTAIEAEINKGMR